MKQKSLRAVATPTLAGAGLALAIVVPVGQGQQPAEKSRPPATVGEKVEQPDRAGQAAAKETQTEERSETRRADAHDEVAAFGVHAEFGGSRLGVAIRDVTAEDVANEKLAGTVGALVTAVDEDSPAAKGGLVEGDVIVAFDGERVRSVRQLSRLVQETPAEREVVVEVVRDGQRQRLQVAPARDGRSWSLSRGKFRDLADKVRIDAERLRREIEATVRVYGTWPDAFKFIAPDFPWSGARLGVSVQPLTPQLAEYFHVAGGVLIFSVEADSPAAKAGLKAGDVVTAVDGKPVEDVAAIRRAVQDRDKREATLGVTRDGQSRSVKVAFPEPAWRTHHQRV
ncbi:MAG: PDZ domain-containing protein [Luteitalea sp.]|nr:PDZ domain-containing protein [Luteitalea sp.]